MSATLSLVPPTGAVALHAHTHTALAYAGATLGSPLSVAMMAFTTCVGIGYAGLLGAAVLLAVVVVVAIAVSSARTVRSALDVHFDLVAKARREAVRQRQLRACGPVRQHQYAELRDLVTEVQLGDPGEAKRFELEELLDQFVALVARHQRCLDWMRRAGACELPPIAPQGPRSKRQDLLARRIQHREQCVARIAKLVDDIESIDELVHLIAQRGACPADEPELERDLERRIWELDEVDAAMEQISASA